ncbi:MAG: hypothetical protein NUV80_02735, partial [Candidatus Berkelbacteria bacterium]|nr:hypothetical protein [Candidatus Berkelbacteria bacterium]
MIKGRGDVSSAIKDRDGFIFYCNGASNRLPLTTDAKVKEITEVAGLDKSKMIVYISSLSIYYSDSKYTEHKRKMEEIVRKNFDNYCIIRI